MEKTYELLGLSLNEKKLYEAILIHPDKTAAEIARVLKMDKSSAYRAAENLLQKRLLISSPKIRGTTLRSSSPEYLIKLYQQKIEEFNSNKGLIENYIRNLKSQTLSLNRETFIRVEYGGEALRKCLLESEQSKEKLIVEIVLSQHRLYQKNRMINFVINHAKRRSSSGIYIKQLERSTYFENAPYKEIMVNTKKYLKEIRILPPEYNDKNSVRIWDNTVNIFSSDEKGDLIVITITDKYVTRSMKTMFDFIWDRSTPYKSPAEL